jgi:hypothetical protein
MPLQQENQKSRSQSIAQKFSTKAETKMSIKLPLLFADQGIWGNTVKKWIWILKKEAELFNERTLKLSLTCVSNTSNWTSKDGEKQGN